MMSYSLHLGRLFGIPLKVHWTFGILILWIFFRNLTIGGGSSQALWSVFFVLAIFVCVTLHELGHALAARHYRIRTRDITLLPIGGVARLEAMPEKPLHELWVAIAGPLVNFILAGLLALLVRYRPNPQDLEGIMTITGHNFLFNLLMVNLWLGLFNLLPAFPMDGGRILRALLALRISRHRATRIAATLGQLLAIAFVVLGFFGNPFLVFIGLFIFLGAQAEAEFVEAQWLLSGYRVADVMMRQFPTLQLTDTVQDAVRMLLNSQCRNFLVLNDGEPVGTLSRDEIIRAISENKHTAPIEEVMNTHLLRLSAEQPLPEIWKFMQEDKHLAPVFEGQQLVGVVDPENIMEFIMIRGAELKTA
ncbi:MAG: site-2 protease family protein [Chitinophagales bacterium]|nr:site-2 protease family protein [Chitinophagales bacterium]MDW8428462.1 site-2 protease family protein [Chitinophagales bacterium]